MKHTVIVTIKVDPTEYVGGEDTDQSAVELVKAMLKGEADIPYKDCSVTSYNDILKRMD